MRCRRFRRVANYLKTSCRFLIHKGLPWTDSSTAFLTESDGIIFGVAQVNIDGDAILRLRFAPTRAAARRSQSASAATVASATAARNAVRKCGDSSDMTLTVATSKANRVGNPIAVDSSAIETGRYDLP
jgi:hypothetical protein